MIDALGVIAGLIGVLLLASMAGIFWFIVWAIGSQLYQDRKEHRDFLRRERDCARRERELMEKEMGE